MVRRDAARARGDLRGARRLQSVLAIGTSGTVYPAAAFVEEVRRHGRARTVELNLEPSAVESCFAERRQGPASELVPRFVEELLGELA